MNRVCRSFVVFALIALGACSAGAGDAAQPSARPLSNGWFELRPEEGVVLQMPNRWNANRGQNGTGPIEFRGPGNARVVVWPVFLPKGQPQPPPFTVVTTLAQRLTQGSIGWSQPAPFGQSAVRMAGRSGQQTALATFAWRDSPQGVAGYFYLTAADSAHYASLQPTFAGILRGTKISGARMAAGGGGSGAAPAPSLQFVQWTDPTEGAFSTEVPRGWNVSGGVVRPAPTQVALPMVIEAPDKRGVVIVGDRNMPFPAAFIEPTQMLMSTGFGEGARYQSSIVRRYTPALALLPEYAQARFGSLCRNIRVTARDDFRNAAVQINQQLQAQAAANGQYARIDLGGLRFECETQQGPASGALIARTHGHSMAVPGIEPINTWEIDYLVGFLAMPERVNEATAIARRVIEKWRFNPQWTGGQVELAGQISRINTDTANATNAIITSSYENQQRTYDELSRRRGNAMLETVDAIDPTTGMQYKIDSTSNHYWIAPNGTIVGTDIQSAPDIDYTEMVQLP